MRITFLIRSIGPRFSATAMVLLRHAFELHRRGGSRVTVIVPADRGDGFRVLPFWREPNLSYKVRKAYNRLRGGRVRLVCRWMENEPGVPIYEVPELTTAHVPDADAVIAGSAWMLDALRNLGDSKGKRFYLAQVYELSDPENRRRYESGVCLIAVSSQLRRRILDAMETRPAVAVVNNGVDVSLFHARDRTWGDPPVRVGMVHYYKGSPDIKAVGDGVRAFAIARESVPGLKLVMFGTRKDGLVPSFAEYHASPSREEVARIYRSCDIFLSPSREEACQLPPMEAMACGCALVATYVGGVPDYTIPDRTALVFPPGHPEQLASGILSLARDTSFARRVAAAGNLHIQSFSWERMSARFERTLRDFPGADQTADSRAPSNVIK